MMDIDIEQIYHEELDRVWQEGYDYGRQMGILESHSDMICTMVSHLEGSMSRHAAIGLIARAVGVPPAALQTVLPERDL